MLNSGTIETIIPKNKYIIVRLPKVHLFFNILVFGKKV